MCMGQCLSNIIEEVQHLNQFALTEVDPITITAVQIYRHANDF